MKINNPEISVIMSVFNGADYLKESIESIINQTYENFEFLIVNDCSIDGSLSIIQSFTDPRIRIINNTQNIGLTKSLNIALKQAKCRFIARQDADDISLPERFQTQHTYLCQNPEVGVLGTRVYTIDDKGVILNQNNTKIKLNARDFRTNQLTHGSVMFHREIVDRLSGYNELFRYCQDYELWLRIIRDYPVHCLPTPLYKLRLHKESIQQKYLSESTLYHILALQMANNQFDNTLINVIQKNGVKVLYEHLNHREKAHYHILRALKLVNNNNGLTAKELVESIKLDPINSTKDILGIFGSYFIRKTKHLSRYK